MADFAVEGDAADGFGDGAVHGDEVGGNGSGQIGRDGAVGMCVGLGPVERNAEGRAAGAACLADLAHLEEDGFGRKIDAELIFKHFI